MKQKKQFRLFDVYREGITGIESCIIGIKSYEYKPMTMTTNGILTVSYIDGDCTMHVVDSEKQLKHAVSVINKKLKNCKKPGPKGGK